MQLFDTHCHIHEPSYKLSIAEVEQRAQQASVDYLLCVGTDVVTSQQAVDFVRNRDNCWASIGLHPHDAKLGNAALEALQALMTVEQVPELGAEWPEGRGSPVARSPQASSGLEDEAQDASRKILKPFSSKIVAVGECGLDYFYQNSNKNAQEKALRSQIELALQHNLPLIFHVRDAFDDFWPIFDSYKNVRGVLHSYTDNQENLDKALARGLYIGLNGIMTFTKNQWQLDVAKAVPLQNLLLETDAPFLTPYPFRGTVNEPAHVRVVAEFLATLKSESLSQIADATTKNAHNLFKTNILNLKSK